jgi:hypothetical protein
MCNKVTKQILKYGIFVLVVFLGAGQGALAGSLKLTKPVTAVYQNIKIYVDGVGLTDLPVVRLEEKGAVMVPVRTLAEALGKPVVWNEGARSIYIGTPPVSGTVTTAPIPTRPVFLEDLKVLRNVGPFYHRQSSNLMVAGRKFTHGVVVELTKGREAETVLELGGKYSLLKGYHGVEDSTQNSSGSYVLAILTDDHEIYKSPQMNPAQYSLPIQLELKGVKRLTIRAVWVAGGTGDYEQVAMALGDVALYPK